MTGEHEIAHVDHARRGGKNERTGRWKFANIWTLAEFLRNWRPLPHDREKSPDYPFPSGTWSRARNPSRIFLLPCHSHQDNCDTLNSLTARWIIFESTGMLQCNFKHIAYSSKYGRTWVVRYRYSLTCLHLIQCSEIYFILPFSSR